MQDYNDYYVTVIYGTGIDIINIDRVRAVVKKWGERFLKKVYTKHEISYCYKRNNPYPSLAVRFAAKEALIKAMAAAIPISFADIEVVNTEAGKPFFVFSEKINAHFKKHNITAAHLSISHDHEYGVASVILERQEIIEERLSPAPAGSGAALPAGYPLLSAPVKR